MSNATQHSQPSGDNKRRRSRGGKNRNRNQQGDRRDGHRNDREHRGDRGPKSNRSEEFRPQAPRPPRGARPIQLSWWQKLLKAVGLYKAPTPPARPEHKPREERPQGETRAPKSNTRNARSGEGGGDSAERSEPRSGEGRPKRNRNERGGGERRSRGGDPSTVESTRVYVGNLSYDVTEQDLQELFKGIGGVRNVEIVYNRSTHRSKGYGFVEMLHMDEAVRCVEVLNEQPFMGRNLTVSGAKSKGQDEREDKDEQSDRSERQVVLAPLPKASAPETSAPAAPAEPEIQTIVENVTEATAAEETQFVTEEASDLVAKYGFDEPEKKSEGA